MLQDHVDQLAAELEATHHSGGEEVTDHLLELIQECSTLSLSLCVLNPMSMLRFQTTRLDQPAQPDILGGPEVPPAPSTSPRVHWQRIEVGQSKILVSEKPVIVLPLRGWVHQDNQRRSSSDYACQRRA